MGIALIIIALFLVGIYLRRYYIVEKGIYLEEGIISRFHKKRSLYGLIHMHKNENNHEEKLRDQSIQMPSEDAAKADARAEQKQLNRQAPQTMEAKMLFNQAIKHYKENNLDEAAKKLIQVIAIDEKFSEAMHKLGLIYLRQKQYSKAEAIFKDLLSLSPEDAVYYSNLGRSLYEQKKFPEALTFYLKSIELDNSRPGRVLSVAEIYREMGDKEKAQEMYKKALEMDGNNVDYLLTFAHFLIEDNKFEQAAFYIDKVIALEPKSEIALDMKNKIANH